MGFSRCSTVYRIIPGLYQEGYNKAGRHVFGIVHGTDGLVFRGNRMMVYICTDILAELNLSCSYTFCAILQVLKMTLDIFMKLYLHYLRSLPHKLSIRLQINEVVKRSRGLQDSCSSIKITLVATKRLLLSHDFHVPILFKFPMYIIHFFFVCTAMTADTITTRKF